ncbi:MAG: arsenate reductase family protein [Candidatus Obscuribacterales bacterium]
MKDKFIVYERPTCSKCREMTKLLKEAGVDFDKVNYYVEPLSPKEIAELLKKMDMPARSLLRTSESIYKELGLAKAQLSDKELIDLMSKHPDLMQRPIVVRGDRAVLGRPTENVQALLQ